MKKVGIITIHNSPNYGASLQAYALYKYIESRGYDCELIDLYRPYQSEYVPSKRFQPYSCMTFKKRVKSYLLGFLGKKKKKASPVVCYYKQAKERFDSFNSVLKYSSAYKSIDMLYETPPIYDIYVSGSDQLWNPTQAYCLEPYFLTFVPKGKKKVSYATSVGITELTTRQMKDFKHWLSSYDYISVRERQAQILLSSFVDMPIHQVCDPTFLLRQDYWREIAIYPPNNKRYMLLFSLSYPKDLVDYCVALSKEAGLPLFIINQFKSNIDMDCRYETVNNAGPREFIGYIGNAEMIITDSFHCTVFSLIMGAKNFFTYISPSNKRGSRIEDLLKPFGLTNHIFRTFGASYSEFACRKIKPQHSICVMEQMRKESIEYINKWL